MNPTEKNRFYKNYKMAAVLIKPLELVFSVLFYAAVFFIALSLVLSFIMVFVSVDAEQLLLSPFMYEITGEAGEVTAYSISFGNGIKLITDTESVELADIKAVINTDAWRSYDGFFDIGYEERCRSQPLWSGKYLKIIYRKGLEQ